jgi:hypothetical protein
MLSIDDTQSMINKIISFQKQWDNSAEALVIAAAPV